MLLDFSPLNHFEYPLVKALRSFGHGTFVDDISSAISSMPLAGVVLGILILFLLWRYPTKRFSFPLFPYLYGSTESSRYPHPPEGGSFDRIKEKYPRSEATKRRYRVLGIREIRGIDRFWIGGFEYDRGVSEEKVVVFLEKP